MSEGAPSQPLPQLLDPRKFAQHDVKLAGIVPEDALPRLLNHKLEHGCSDTPRNARATLQFFVDEQGRRCVSGEVLARVLMECQRCLEALEIEISTQVSLAVVWKEEDSRQLPANLEPWIVSEEQGDLYAILEEELLLAMPAVAYHDFQCIDASLLSSGQGTQEPAGEQTTQNPFGVLAALKQELQKDD
ncbi:uncharacterized protein P886_3359 [Alteromonadaceae bacterium 2753L.S.0a.02]|nr:uncharacterized protein P886_3359 [Alteromonadaceae bacterium 2753L.S.0a.02]